MTTTRRPVSRRLRLTGHGAFCVLGAVALAGCSSGQDDEAGPTASVPSPPVTGSTGESGATGDRGTGDETGAPSGGRSGTASSTEEYAYEVQQQLGVSAADREAVEAYLGSLWGEHAAEMVSVLPSVQAGGTRVVDRRVWPLVGTAHLACRGTGDLVWAGGAVDTLADDDTLSCGAAGDGASASSSPAAASASPTGTPAPEATRGMSDAWSHVLALAPQPDTQSWIGVHVPLAEGEADPALAAHREAALQGLAEAPESAHDRGVVELGQGLTTVVTAVQVQAGREVHLEAHCRGEGSVDVELETRNDRRETRTLECTEGRDRAGGDTELAATAYGSFTQRTLRIEAAPGTRAVVSFQAVVRGA